MVEHYRHAGQLLKKLDDLGVTQNTIVVYTTDNGAEVMSWPDGAIRRSGAKRRQLGRRIPRAMVIRWPGVIRPGNGHNEMFSHST